ncbi:MAG: hypothetical protein FJ304_26495 [Planctomycetes bacterium]|nr:hypothetical protein [Planctomycetota bacterium]
MNPSLLLAAALVAPAAPLPRDAAPSEPGPAPRVLALKADTSGAVRVIGTVPTKVTVTNTHFTIEQVVQNGQPVQRQVQKNVDQDIVTTTYLNKSLSEFNGTFSTADGKPLSLADATSRIKNGATVLASADGKPIAKTWLRAVSGDTVVMVAEGLSHAQPQWGAGGALPTTPAPRLTMLGADETGKVIAPCTSQPLNANGGVYYDEMMFEGGGRAWRGKGFRGDIGYIDYGSQQYGGKVVNKPLAEVKFEAYDLTGKFIPKGTALKRLAAGGMVIVAGNNQMPDAAYLQGFHPDVMVLVSADLVLPNPVVDQTKKKTTTPGKGEPKQEPAVDLPAVQPLPAIKPAIIQRRAGGNVILPVEKVEK